MPMTLKTCWSCTLLFHLPVSAVIPKTFSNQENLVVRVSGSVIFLESSTYWSVLPQVVTLGDNRNMNEVCSMLWWWLHRRTEFQTNFIICGKYCDGLSRTVSKHSNYFEEWCHKAFCGIAETLWSLLFDVLISDRLMWYFCLVLCGILILMTLSVQTIFFFLFLSPNSYIKRVMSTWLSWK